LNTSKSISEIFADAEGSAVLSDEVETIVFNELGTPLNLPPALKLPDMEYSPVVVRIRYAALSTSHILLFYYNALLIRRPFVSLRCKHLLGIEPIRFLISSSVILSYSSSKASFISLLLSNARRRSRCFNSL